MDTFSIIYEDEDLLVADKLAPVPVQPEKSGDPSLQDILKGPGRPFLEAAHRIDRRASGAVLFAKTPKALSTLEAAFRHGRIEKEYVACVEREPDPAVGRLEHALEWDKRRNLVRASPVARPAGAAAAMEGPGSDPAARPARTGGGARPEGGARAGAPGRPELAVLEYRLACRSERYFFVEVELVTGRHHQIRAQLSAAGWPIRGDLKYGARRSCRNGLIMLHARRLAFPQPRTGERVEAVAPFPASEPLWSAYAPEGSERGE